MPPEPGLGTGRAGNPPIEPIRRQRHDRHRVSQAILQCRKVRANQGEGIRDPERAPALQHAQMADCEKPARCHPRAVARIRKSGKSGMQHGRFEQGPTTKESLPNGAPGCPGKKSRPRGRRVATGAKRAQELIGCGTTIRFIKDAITDNPYRDPSREHFPSVPLRSGLRQGDAGHRDLLSAMGGHDGSISFRLCPLYGTAVQSQGTSIPAPIYGRRQFSLRYDGFPGPGPHPGKKSSAGETSFGFPHRTLRALCVLDCGTWARIIPTLVGPGCTD